VSAFTWKQRYDTNCYSNHGAGSRLGHVIRGISYASCKKRCQRNTACVTITSGPTYASARHSACWLHTSLDSTQFDGCEYGPYVSAYIKERATRSLLQEEADLQEADEEDRVAYKWETQWNTNCYTNHGTGSMIGHPIRRISRASCQKRCGRNPSCVTFTIGPTNVRDGRQTCWMHTSIDSMTFDGCAYGPYVSSFAYTVVSGKKVVKNSGSSLLQEQVLQKLAQQEPEEDAEAAQ